MVEQIITETRRLSSAQPTKGEVKNDCQAQFPSLSANRASAPVANHDRRPRAQRGARPRRGFAEPRQHRQRLFRRRQNTAAGDTSFLFNGTFTGSFNVGLGRQVMESLTTGSNNVAIGHGANASDTTGSDNVATGTLALSATPPAPTTSPPALRRSSPTQAETSTSPAATRRSLQHRGRRQRRDRHPGARVEYHRV